MCSNYSCSLHAQPFHALHPFLHSHSMCAYELSPSHQIDTQSLFLCPMPTAPGKLCLSHERDSWLLNSVQCMLGVCKFSLWFHLGLFDKVSPCPHEGSSTLCLYTEHTCHEYAGNTYLLKFIMANVFHLENTFKMTLEFCSPISFKIPFFCSCHRHSNPKPPTLSHCAEKS